MFLNNFIKILIWYGELLKIINMSIVYIIVSYFIASSFTLFYVFVMHYWVIEVWCPIKEKKV